jgi:hypothetical protein
MRVWWRTLRQLVPATLAIMIPLQVANAIIIALTFPSYLETLESYPEQLEWFQQVARNPESAPPPPTVPQPAPGEYGWLVLGELVLILLALVASALILGIAIRVALGALTGGPIGWREALSEVADRARSLVFLEIVAYILLGVLAVVTFFLLAIPALWLAIAWCVAFPVVMFEGLRNFEALSRSFRLVRHRWWATTGTLSLMVLVQLLIIVPLTAPYVAGLFLGWDPILTIALGIGLGLIGSALVYPLTGTTLAAIYADLRLRKEGAVPVAGPSGAIEWRMPAAPAPEPPALPERP